jgi:hypothetical protein
MVINTTMPPSPQNPFGSTNNFNAGSMSSSASPTSMYSYADFDKERRDEEEMLEKCEKADEVMKRIKKIIEYAEKNLLNTQETLEAFFTEEEIDLYNNYFTIKEATRKIKEKRAEQAEKAAEAITEYYSPNLGGTVITPYEDNTYNDNTAGTSPKSFSGKLYNKLTKIL